MRLALATLVALSLAGCSHSPMSPDPAPAPVAANARVWGMVIESGGACLEGGAVAIVTGQTVSQSQKQETPCDVWGYGGGFLFTGLTPGSAMTLRASAPGYVTADVVARAQTGGQVFEIVLTKAK